MEVKDSHDWVTAVKNMGRRHMRVNEGAEDFTEARRREYSGKPDLHQEQEAVKLSASITRATIADTTTACEESSTKMVERVTRCVPDQG